MNMCQYDRARQIALYLTHLQSHASNPSCKQPMTQIHSSAQVLFVPECLCFIFKCVDYHRSPECQNRVDPVPVPLR